MINVCMFDETTCAIEASARTSLCRDQDLTIQGTNVSPRSIFEKKDHYTSLIPYVTRARHMFVTSQ